MKRSDAEPVIRHLTRQWAELNGIAAGASEQPSFSDFKQSAYEHGFSAYLAFRSVAGALEDTEHWFDQELRQTWRN